MSKFDECQIFDQSWLNGKFDWLLPDLRSNWSKLSENNAILKIWSYDQIWEKSILDISFAAEGGDSTILRAEGAETGRLKRPARFLTLSRPNCLPDREPLKLFTVVLQYSFCTR